MPRPFENELRLKARDFLWLKCVDCTNFRPRFRQRGTHPTPFVGKGRDGEGDAFGQTFGAQKFGRWLWILKAKSYAPALFDYRL